MSDTPNCRARMWRRFRELPCSRRATRDGYCGQHHPDAEAAREAKSRAKWDAQQAARVAAETRDRNRVKAEGLREFADWLETDSAWPQVAVLARRRADALEAGL